MAENLRQIEALDHFRQLRSEGREGGDLRCGSLPKTVMHILLELQQSGVEAQQLRRGLVMAFEFAGALDARLPGKTTDHFRSSPRVILRYQSAWCSMAQPRLT